LENIELNEDNFYNYKEMGHKSLKEQYLLSIFFVMNIFTTVGCGEGLPQNDLERCIFFVILYVGNAVFAIAFGIIASNIQIFHEKYTDIFDSMR
jgi:hypothetical protein